MPTNKSWTMNCVLLGATAARLLQNGKEEEAREKIASLTSEFEPVDIDYLLRRLKEVRSSEVTNEVPVNG